MRTPEKVSAVLSVLLCHQKEKYSEIQTISILLYCHQNKNELWKNRAKYISILHAHLSSHFLIIHMRASSTIAQFRNTHQVTAAACGHTMDDTNTPLLYSRNHDASWKRIESIFDAIYYFAHECLEMMIEMHSTDINEISEIYHHTPLIASIHLNNYEAVKILLRHEQIDVNKCESDLGWTPLHECVRFGRDEIAKLLIAHSQSDIWIKSFEDELAVDIGQYMGHDNKCTSLINIVRGEQYRIIKKQVVCLPESLCREITEFTY